MKTRTLLNGKKIKELPRERSWKMGSRCPHKYLIIDCEDGNLWVPRAANDQVMDMAGKVTIDLVNSAKKAIRLWEKFRKDKA